MAASILLIYIPLLCSLLFGFLLSRALISMDFFARRNGLLFFFLCTLFFPVVLFSGSFFGLIFSLQINRIFFDFTLLSTVLPEGIVMWFGDGPAPTRQLRPYWNTVRSIVWILFPIITCATFYLRNRKFETVAH